MVWTLLAAASLVPSITLAWRRAPKRDGVFWAAVALGVVGPLLWVTHAFLPAWQTGLAPTLWMTIAVTMVVYALVAGLAAGAWRLAPLVGGYMGILAVVAILGHNAEAPPLVMTAAPAWVSLHIVTAVLTYVLVTLAAVAAVAASIKESALKRKRATPLSRLLPSIAECEDLLVHLLSWGEAVLAVGLVTGMAVEYQEANTLIPLTHKTILTIAAFVVIGGLIFAHHRAGVRGRRFMRLVLIGYLLLTLGYPGVKLITGLLVS